MMAELTTRGIHAESETPVKVYFKNIVAGDYYADFLVEGKVIVELKVAKEYSSNDEAQLLNELKASNMEVGLPINFGADKVEFRRFIL